MKTWTLTLSAACLALVLGCDSKSPPGGPKANQAKNETHVGTADETFKLGVPMTETNLNQGETKKVNISMTRGKNFDQDVDVKFTDVPKGVTVEPMSGTLKASDKEWQGSVTASPEAALGHHEITVTATPKTGAATTTKFKIEVKKP